jgi:hypothetical protein
MHALLLSPRYMLLDPDGLNPASAVKQHLHQLHCLDCADVIHLAFTNTTMFPNDTKTHIWRHIFVTSSTFMSNLVVRWVQPTNGWDLWVVDRANMHGAIMSVVCVKKVSSAIASHRDGPT